MKVHLDCYPCLLRQALEAAQLSGADESQQTLLLSRSLDLLQDHLGQSAAPPEIAYSIHQLVREQMGDHDPYGEAKHTSTRQALSFYPQLEEWVAVSADPLDTALRISIAGNIIDLGFSAEYDLESTLPRVLMQDFAIDDRAAFRSALDQVRRILFLADNAGETVFDRVLIETMERPVTYVVKGGPVINDATRLDAVEAGLDAVADIIDTGTNAPGTILDRCSADFQTQYADADLVIAKGQANYETLSHEGPRLFFLLQIKCPVIGRSAGAPVGSIVVQQGRSAED